MSTVYLSSEEVKSREQLFEERRKAEFEANGANKIPNRDFLGRILEPGDCVLFRQRYFEPFGQGIVAEESEWPFSGSVMVKIMNRGPKEKEKRPYKGNQLIKISREEIMLRVLEGDTHFLKEYRKSRY